MMPSEASVHSTDSAPQAVFAVYKLRKRSDYLSLNRARRHIMPTMVVQGRCRQDGSNEVRVGFTCSKKVGNAVARNRAKRRLRHSAVQVLQMNARQGWDYALIGRANTTVDAAFDDLLRHLETALSKLHASE